MASPDATTWVTEEIVIEASPETVFSFFVDPNLMRRWLGGHALLVPEPGGAFAVDIGSNHARGSYVEVTPASKVVFTWGWEGSESVPPGSSMVTFTFEPVAGGTLLTMVHSGLLAEEAERHRHGWVHYLNRLAVAAPGGDAGLDPHAQGGGIPLHERGM